MDPLTRLTDVWARVEAAAERSGRSELPDLVIVSKGRSTDEIGALLDSGHLAFGENRAQELRDKVAVLGSSRQEGGPEWHFVGPLQSNKVRVVRPAVVALHSLDRVDLGPAWMKGQGPPPRAYLQVNVGGEPQKSGVSADEADAACDRLMSIGVPLVGLMTVPPRGESPADARPHFAMLRRIRDRVASRHPGVVGLSMGMTEDFEVAVEEGSTVLRLGRAIFG